MNAYPSILELISLRSFSSIWYWITLVITWSVASHWVLGVPSDLITRARRQGGAAEAELEAMARANAVRLVQIPEGPGVWLTGLAFFGLTVLAVLGFGYGVEFAQALLFILLPIAGVSALSLRAARGVVAGGAVLPQMQRHRARVNVIAMISMFLTALWGMYQNMLFAMPGV
jgi:hypothetical protein